MHNYLKLTHLKYFDNLKPFGQREAARLGLPKFGRFVLKDGHKRAHSITRDLYCTIELGCIVACPSQHRRQASLSSYQRRAELTADQPTRGADSDGHNILQAEVAQQLERLVVVGVGLEVLDY